MNDKEVNKELNAEENSELSELEAEIAKVSKERDDYLSGWQRARADLINHKNEESKRLEDVVKYGNEALFKDLIITLHTFDLALSIMDKDKVGDDFSKGLVLVRSKLEAVLKKRGLEEIKLKPGDQFDPSIAEAMLEVESDMPEGTVAEIIEPGYKLHDKVIRAAKVTISRSHK